MSDDEDYMSDKFLLGTEKYIAPSLIHRHADKRELEILKKKAEIEAKLKDKNKSVRVMEEEKREEGLSSAISSDNKGFEMLTRMGYKPGQGIGKKESGISEPISIDLKTNRLGLGKAPKMKQAKLKNPNANLENMNTDDFRGRIAQKKAEQMIEIDLHRSQKVCEQLDTQNKLEEPREVWFWLPVEKEKKESDDETDDEEDEDKEEDTEDNTMPPSEKLEILTKYLRDQYFYCIWCGATYNDEDDLRDNCAGTTRDDH